MAIEADVQSGLVVTRERLYVRGGPVSRGSDNRWRMQYDVMRRFEGPVEADGRALAFEWFKLPEQQAPYAAFIERTGAKDDPVKPTFFQWITSDAEAGAAFRAWEADVRANRKQSYYEMVMGLSGTVESDTFEGLVAAAYEQVKTRPQIANAIDV